MSKYYSTVLEDLENGSDSCILSLPEELLKKEDWNEGDVISIKIVNNHIELTNRSKQDRERIEEKRA